MGECQLSAGAGTDRPAHRDRRAGLVAFGIVQILLGVLAGLAALVSLAAVLLFQVLHLPAPPGAAPAMAGDALLLRQGLFNTGAYAVLAVGCVWLGIGSILARRWARALTLAAAWTWLVAGVPGLAVVVLMRDALCADMPPAPPGVRLAILIVAGLISGLLLVLLPAACLLFYGSRHVRATCELRNPRPAWTDACPIPVLVLLLCLGMQFMAQGWLAFYRCAVPCFGRVVSGAPGAALLTVAALLLVQAAWGCFRLQRWGWWLAFGLVALTGAAWGMTLARLGMFGYYGAAGIPLTVSGELFEWEARHGAMLSLLPLSHSVLLLLYMVWVRRRFFPCCARQDAPRPTSCRAFD